MTEKDLRRDDEKPGGEDQETSTPSSSPMSILGYFQHVQKARKDGIDDLLRKTAHERN